MNRFLTRSTDKPQRLPLVYLLAAFWSTTSLACVSQPKPVSENAPAATMSTAAPDSVKPEPIAMFHGAPAAASGKTILAVPEVQLPVPASPLPSRKPTVDITVLSASPVITFAPVRLPEPNAPAPTAAVKPSAPAPATVPPASQVSKPGAASSASAATSPAASTKPTTAPAVAKPKTAANPEPSQAVVLPASPASSARVEPASRPVAETKLETARGERFELRFPGSGWIYLGDELGREGLRYETRRFEDNAAIFAMNPEQAGEYLLRFQRQNPVDRSNEVSLVRVIVTDKPASSAAPQTSPPTATATGSSPTSYATPDPAVPLSTAGTTTSAIPAAGVPAQTPSASPTTPTATPATQSASQLVAQPNPTAGIDIQSITDPLELIKRARDELDAKRTQTALDALDRYLSLYPYGSDEVYFLYGLAYEQDTPFRNIKKAYDSYRRVRDEYPRSVRWKDATERIVYLEKHYFGLH